MATKPIDEQTPENAPVESEDTETTKAAEGKVVTADVMEADSAKDSEPEQPATVVDSNTPTSAEKRAAEASTADVADEPSKKQKVDEAHPPAQVSS